jgi:8-oxo-dGTP diphosphatase
MMKKAGSYSLTKVAAAVIERDGKVLMARRRQEIGFGGFWEFPGGRLEDGETPEKGLEREIAEELGVRIRVGEFLQSVTYRSPALSIELLAYRAILISNDFNLTDHDEILWAEPSELEERDFSEPDRPIVRLLVSRSARATPPRPQSASS